MNRTIGVLILISFFMTACKNANNLESKNDKRITHLLEQMTLKEKIGQMMQVNRAPNNDSLVRKGSIGSILNETDVNEINRLQEIAIKESRLGIPLLFGRDVIHGFKTIFPIPLGQGATWNPELIRQGARVAAVEARSSGINWTFSPMIDVTRDPRWGRVAEGYGEDPLLTSQMGIATIKGYQGDSLSGINSVAACAKHFAAYGAAEAGRDYHTVTLPENELRDVFLPPFKAAVENGVATFMAAFNEINGVPATGNDFLFRKVIRDEWDFKGMVVSDWSSVQQLVVHGYANDNKAAALKALNAGIDMEMASTCYADYLEILVKEGNVSVKLIDEAVSNILSLKFKMGLFDDPFTYPENYPEVLNDKHRDIAKQTAIESIVLLKNENNLLPLNRNIKSVAIIGPLANAPHDQLGTWIFDGNKKHAVTPLYSIKTIIGEAKVHYVPGMEISRTMHKNGFKAALDAAKQSELVILFIGEESILSGESHCRADINLPGLQNELIDELAKTGRPIVAVVLAGRPLTFEKQATQLDALLYAWHPGTMAGPAIADILFGVANPSGKLPITFPKTVGQIPVYYAQKNSGKPATDDTWERMDEIPAEAFQLSVGNTNHYIDYGFKPWFPFGYGLSYTNFEYSDIRIKQTTYKIGDTLEFKALLKNNGEFEGKEVAQLYIRDLFGSRTRPVKQLKAFKKVYLKPGEQIDLDFKLHTNELGFYNQQMNYVTEPGNFKAGIGTNSELELTIDFNIE